MELKITEQQYNKLNNSLSLKKAAFKYWDKFGGKIDYNFLMLFGFKNNHMKVEGLTINDMRRFLVEWRGYDKSINLTKELLEKNPHHVGGQNWAGGYNFSFNCKNITIDEYQIYVEVMVDLTNATVDLIMVGGDVLDLEDAINDSGIGYEIEGEVEDCVTEYMFENVIDVTGINVTISSVLYENSKEG